VWVVLVSFLARATALPRAQRIISVRLRPCRDDADEVAARLARSIDALLRLDLPIFRRSCWKRAMVLHRFLALHGIDSRINFGVQKPSSGATAVEGHAWLERDGLPFLEETPSTYVVTFSLPLPAAGVAVPRR
jgi:Transglutaminase-like superfamily